MPSAFDVLFECMCATLVRAWQHRPLALSKDAVLAPSLHLVMTHCYCHVHAATQRTRATRRSRHPSLRSFETNGFERE